MSRAPTPARARGPRGPIAAALLLLLVAAGCGETEPTDAPSETAAPGSGEPAALEPPRPAPAIDAQAPFAPGGRVYRIGELSLGGGTVNGESRMLARPRMEYLGVKIDEPTPAGTLVVAAAAQGGEGPIHCKVTIAPAGKPALPSVALDPLNGGPWLEERIEVEGLEEGTLGLECKMPTGGFPKWSRPYLIPREPEGATPLIVVVSLDTLRSDHTEGFGAPEGLTPTLRRMGDEGLRGRQATSEATWTAPSHYALLRSNFVGFPPGDTLTPNVAEVLADAGFATVSLNGGGFVSAEFMLPYGFDYYDEYRDHPDDWERKIDDAIGWIERLRSVPTFLFLHTYKVHEMPPEERAFIDRSGVDKAFRPSPAQNQSMLEFYRERTREVDRGLARLFDTLREEAERRPVIALVTSDHGQAFLEHGRYGHGDIAMPVAYDEVSRVPFIVWAPGVIPPGSEDPSPLMLADVAPTLLRAAGLEAPGTMRGRDRWDAWVGGEAPGREGSVTLAKGRWHYRTPTRKLVLPARGVSAEPMLFHLDADPAETRNVLEEHPEEAESLERALREELVRFQVLASADEPLPDCPQCKLVELGAHLGGLRRALLGDDHPAMVLQDAEREEKAVRERLRALGYVE